MNLEMEKLLNKMYYYYLDVDEAQKVIDYVVSLEEKITKINRYIKKVKPKMFKCHNKPAIYILTDFERLLKNEKNS